VSLQEGDYFPLFFIMKYITRTATQEQMKVIRDWLHEHEDTRCDSEEIRAQLRFSNVRFKRAVAIVKAEDKARDKMATGEPEMSYLDVPQSADAQWDAVWIRIVQDALNGKAKSQELVAKVLGKTVDRQEIKLGTITADDLIRIEREARQHTKRLESPVTGEGEVPRERSLLRQ
jgi:hypothetical protein